MSPPVLLSLRALGLGDLLTAVPALRALRRAFPEHTARLATDGALRPLAELTGAVDEVVPARPLAPLDDRLAGPDVAVNLHGRGPQSHRVLLGLGPERLIAFAHPEVAETRGLPAWREDEHEVSRWCRLLEESGVAADPSDLRLRPPPVPVPPRWRGATVLHPGAKSGSRIWPPERWAAVAAAERRAGRRVLLTGGSGELHLARAVAEAAGLPSDAVLAGDTDVVQLAALVAAAGRVLCGDTGVAHLATAFGTPSVVLFGPTPPERWGPPSDGPHVALWAGTSGEPLAEEPDPGLMAIGAEDVVRAIHELEAGADLPVR